MERYKTTVLHRKTAKAIMHLCYEADRSASIAPDRLSVNGNTITASVAKDGGGYNILITSSVFQASTLEGLVADALPDIEK